MSELNKLLEIITEVKNEMEKIDPNIKERLSYLNESLFESGDIIDIKEEQDGFVPRTSLREAEEKTKERATRTYTIHEIPLIPISELGWANNEDGAEGDTQRSVLEAWLKGVEGPTIQKKIENVVLRMETGWGDIPKSDNLKEYIQQVMSYLVFLKTLTMAITNFNASAAGFNFEAFLSALLGGSQIPASGADTIADIYVPISSEGGSEMVPVSLKLYEESGLEVGGSFTALADDLMNPSDKWQAWASKEEHGGGAMRYIVCTKDFKEAVKGDPLSRQGDIKFYEFDVTRNNLFDLFSRASDLSRKAIAIEEGFKERLTAWDDAGRKGEIPDVRIQDELGNMIPLPDASEKGRPNELADVFERDFLMPLAPAIEKVGFRSDQVTALIKGIRTVYERYMEETGEVNKFPKTAAHAEMKKVVSAQEVKEKTGLTMAGFRDGIFGEKEHEGRPAAFRAFKEQVINVADVRGQAIEALSWIYADKKAASSSDIAQWYNGLSQEAKKVAIANTRGYLTRKKWLIPRGKAITYAAEQGKAPFAVLPIGAKFVEDMLEGVRNEVMDDVFRIFDQMAQMSRQLNMFFAKGLKQPEEAKAGAKAGETAAKGAREFAK